MKAVRYYGKEDIRVEDTAAPSDPGPKQIVVKPKVCGICGTDLHEYATGPIVTPIHKHQFTGATLPQILGHEFSAEVIAVGAEVTRVRAGERVSIQPLVMPLDDYYSRRGLNHLSPRMGCIGLSWAWGGMGEYAIINDYNANRLPDSVNDEQGALIEPAAVALYGVERAKVGGGSTVLITGAGPIGALSALASAALGASILRSTLAFYTGFPVPQMDRNLYYTKAPLFEYAKIIHKYALNNHAFCFGYDEVAQDAGETNQVWNPTDFAVTIRSL